MSFSIQRGDFVQILNTGKGHWVTAASIGAPPCVVRVYDSLYSSAGTAGFASLQLQSLQRAYSCD